MDSPLTPDLPTPTAVLPHAAPLRLLDRLLDLDSHGLRASGRVDPRQPFWRDGRVGGWIGVEYMTQAIAAWLACQAKAEPPQVALRRIEHYQSLSAALPPGPLEVVIRHLGRDAEGRERFACRLQGVLTPLAEAELAVAVEPPLEAIGSK
ncbi:hypothetical protein [Chitinimonas lacunae]|uniref:3-hydroxylacyl-ACP dehydratase n=1 Tax=Chitinimonas lacunae TaxID=1963018 RepID=A0ABV8MKL9_9NEIS